MKNFLILCLLFLAVSVCSAQPGPPPPDPGEPVPITGIEWLMGAGALLGVKKLLQRKGK